MRVHFNVPILGLEIETPNIKMVLIICGKLFENSPDISRRHVCDIRMVSHSVVLGFAREMTDAEHYLITRGRVCQKTAFAVAGKRHHGEMFTTACIPVDVRYIQLSFFLFDLRQAEDFYALRFVSGSVVLAVLRLYGVEFLFRKSQLFVKVPLVQ